MVNLNLQGNFFKLIPDEILQIRTLQRLDLSFNEGIQLRGISQLTSLQELRLEQIQLRTMEELLPLATQLTHLNVSNNLLNIIHPYLVRIPRLVYDRNPLWYHPEQTTHLTFCGRQLRELPVELFEIERIDSIDLSENPEIDVHHIQCLQTLFHCILSNCEWVSIHPEVFTLHQLQSLVLCNNKIDRLPGDIALLTQLEYLDLRDNYLTSLPKEVLELPELVSLDVSYNMLTELPPEFETLFDRQLDVTFDNNPYYDFSEQFEEQCVMYLITMMETNEQEELYGLSNHQILEKLHIYMGRYVSPPPTSTVVSSSFIKHINLLSSCARNTFESIYEEDEEEIEHHFTNDFALDQEEVEYEYDYSDFSNDMFL